MTNKEWLKTAYRFAQNNSDDPRTQTGAVLINEKEYTIGFGANTFPKNVEKTSNRLERPAKYMFMEHAERNAILMAALHGKRTKNSILYAPWFACADCARSIIQAGIKKVVGHKQIFEAYGAGPWDESINAGNDMFKEAGVELEYYDGEIGEIEILLNGKLWKP